MRASMWLCTIWTRIGLVIAVSSYSVPNAPDLKARAQGIDEARHQYIYANATFAGGPGLITGSKGDVLAALDTKITLVSLGPQLKLTSGAVNATAADLDRVHRLKRLEDYPKLYGNGKWAGINMPLGSLTNYTSDLSFSMQRLTVNPYFVRRLDPRKDDLPFIVGEREVLQITTTDLKTLHAQGRLFYTDYRFLKKFARSPKAHYSGFTETLFYIHPRSGEFLPLAIRTNANRHSLMYTSQDSREDWLLAKMMANVDDSWAGAYHHFASTHYVLQRVFGAALRTLSDQHPIKAFLARIMTGAMGFPALAKKLLFVSPSFNDNLTPWSGPGAEAFVADLFFREKPGMYRANYLEPSLRAQGLLDCVNGPQLSHFPFYKDAAAIAQVQRDFLTEFIASYYASDEDLTKDGELRAWLDEASGPAKVRDFYDSKSLECRADLVELLVHFAHLSSVAHHANNLNQMLTSSLLLPMSPAAIHQPVPTTKGIKDVVPFLPSFNQSLEQMRFAGYFARPLEAGKNGTLVHMYDDPSILGRMNDRTRAANDKFKAAMEERHRIVSSRTLDQQGLSQGAPFIWTALDPEAMPFNMLI